jgi:hypothetical protein
VAGGLRPPGPSRPRWKTQRVRPRGACAGGLVHRPPDLAVEARERAFKAYIVDGNKIRAAAIAFELSREHHNKRRFSIASAWAARGERVLEGEPEGLAHAYQALWKSLAAERAGDVELAIRLAGRAVELGTRFSDADIRAWDCCSKDGS